MNASRRTQGSAESCQYVLILLLVSFFLLEGCGIPVSALSRDWSGSEPLCLFSLSGHTTGYRHTSTKSSHRVV